MGKSECFCILYTLPVAVAFVVTGIYFVFVVEISSSLKDHPI